MNETYQPDPTQQLAFCQICGRAVASDADRLAGRAFACGLCNETKLAVPASVGAPYPGSETPGPGPSATFGGGIPPGAIPPYAPPPSPAGDVPNPGLAALLGLIPGVGAMYNGQYAKGIVHLIVFAVLSSLVDTNGIFLLFVFGWVAYQSIEAHHTARARRDGTPLPNPFGLNDIGEKLGFGKSWPNYPSNPGVPPAGPRCRRRQTLRPHPPALQPPTGEPHGRATVTLPPPVPALCTAPPVPPVHAAARRQTTPPYQPVTPPPFAGETYVPFDPNAEHPYPAPRHRFPRRGHLAHRPRNPLSPQHLGRLPWHQLQNSSCRSSSSVIGIWLFINRMTRHRPQPRRRRQPRIPRPPLPRRPWNRLAHPRRRHLLPRRRQHPHLGPKPGRSSSSSPGVMAFVERAVYRGAGPGPYNYGPPIPPAPPSPYAANPGTAIVPTETAPSTNSQEGR